MIADLKPYAEYKESGLPWLGLCVRIHEMSADVLGIDKEADGPHGAIIIGRLA